MEFSERKRLLIFGLPWTFTKYTVKEDLLTIVQGLIKQVENDCYIYKIQDVTLSTSLFEKLFGLGTVICFTADITSPELKLIHVKNARAIKDFILEMSESERRRRRTINTQDISAVDTMYQD